MPKLIIRVAVCILTFAVGTAAHYFRTTITGRCRVQSEQIVRLSPGSIGSLSPADPWTEFTATVNKLWGLGTINTRIHFDCVFDANGHARDVQMRSRYPQLKLKSWGKWRDPALTADEELLPELTRKLMAAAAAQMQQIQFSPPTGEVLSQSRHGTAVLEAALTRLPEGTQGTRCDSIRLTLVENSRIASRGTVWANGCVVY